MIENSYNVHEHSHTQWSDEKLDQEMAMCDILLEPWQRSEERRRQVGLRALLAREEMIHRYAERYEERHIDG